MDELVARGALDGDNLCLAPTLRNPRAFRSYDNVKQAT